MKLQLEVLTPVKSLLNEEVDEITIHTANGEISILPNHMSLLTKILPGEMIVRKNNKSEVYAVTGGFLEIADNKVNILADYAIHSQEIEVAKVEEAKKRAEKAMLDKTNEEEYEQLQTQIRQTALELKVARKHRTSHPS